MSETKNSAYIKHIVQAIYIVHTFTVIHTRNMSFPLMWALFQVVSDGQIGQISWRKMHASYEYYHLSVFPWMAQLTQGCYDIYSHILPYITTWVLSFITISMDVSAHTRLLWHILQAVSECCYLTFTLLYFVNNSNT